MTDHDLPNSRRTFLAVSAAAAAGLANAGPLLAATGTARPAEAPDPDAWLHRFKAPHRQVFDAKSTVDGGPLGQVRNFLDAYKETYGVEGAQLDVCVGLHGPGYGLVLGDALWERYEVGKLLKVDDPATSAPATRNLFFKTGAPGLPGASIEELQQRGVVFLLCNNTLKRITNAFAKSSGKTPEVMRQELIDGMIPQVTIVPAMVLALHRLQERQFRYIYVG